jgi:SAM-dependent methyltransferase
MSEAHEWGTAPDFVGPRHDLRERLLLSVLLEARPGPRVLDVGAGQGSFSARLAARGFEVVSTDASAAAVIVLRSRLAGEVVIADATRLPFEEATFDAVVLGEVLEHIESDQTAVTEAARVLRSSGILALSVPGNPRLFGPSDRWAGHVRRYTRDGLIATVEAGGLAVERCVPWGFPVSALYHRHVYERHVDRHGSAQPKRWQRPAVSLLGGLLQLDRLFVGVERGSLGYLLVARRP